MGGAGGKGGLLGVPGKKGRWILDVRIGIICWLVWGKGGPGWMSYWGKEREAKGEEACMEFTEKRKGSTYIVLGIRKVILQPYAPAHRAK